MIIQVICLLAGVAAVATAQSVPPLINYQGRLANADGTPFATGEYELRVSLYDSAVGGNLLWGPQLFDGVPGVGHGPRVPVVQGYFNAVVGPSDTQGRPMVDAFGGADRFVEVTVSNRAPVLPRAQLVSGPFAVRALSATELRSNGSSASNGIILLPDGTLQLNRYGGAVVIGSSNATGSGWLFEAQSARQAAALRAPWGYWMFGYVADNGAGHEEIRIGYGAPSPNQQTIDLFSGGASRIRLETNGVVGIGFSHPSDTRYALMVNGSACAAGSWVSCSDEAVKRDFSSVDSRSILTNLSRLPISTWAYTNSPEVRHIGPMAQAFAAAFAVGFDDKHIAAVDADGVALASIQALYGLLKEKDDELASLRRDIRLLMAERDERREIKEAVNRLENEIAQLRKRRPTAEALGQTEQ